MLERNAQLSRRIARNSALSSFLSRRDANGENMVLLERDNSVVDGRESAKARNAEIPRRSVDLEVFSFEPFQDPPAFSLLMETLIPRENTAANGSTTVKARSALLSENVVYGEVLSTETPSDSVARWLRETVENKRDVAVLPSNASILFAKQERLHANSLEKSPREAPLEIASSRELANLLRENIVAERPKLAKAMLAN